MHHRQTKPKNREKLQVRLGYFHLLRDTFLGLWVVCLSCSESKVLSDRYGLSDGSYYRHCVHYFVGFMGYRFQKISGVVRLLQKQVQKILNFLIFLHLLINLKVPHRFNDRLSQSRHHSLSRRLSHFCPRKHISNCQQTLRTQWVEKTPLQ